MKAEIISFPAPAAKIIATKFAVGKTYETRSACDHDCIFSFTVTARTEKRMTLEYHGKPSVVGLKVDSDGVEWCFPMGRYSMAPVIRANRENA